MKKKLYDAVYTSFRYSINSAIRRDAAQAIHICATPDVNSCVSNATHTSVYLVVSRSVGNPVIDYIWDFIYEGQLKKI
jgi:hypothetical protein